MVGSLQDIEKQKIETNEQITSFQRNYWGLLEKQYSSPSFYIENFEEFKVDGRFSLRSPFDGYIYDLNFKENKLESANDNEVAIILVIVCGSKQY